MDWGHIKIGKCFMPISLQIEAFQRYRWPHPSPFNQMSRLVSYLNRYKNIKAPNHFSLDQKTISSKT